MKIIKAEPDYTDYATGYQEACWTKGEAGYAKAKDLEWYIVDTYPISRIFDAPDKEWFEQEQKFASEDGRHGQYNDLLEEEIREPIILFDNGIHGYIWDGWHRT